MSRDAKSSDGVFKQQWEYKLLGITKEINWFFLFPINAKEESFTKCMKIIVSKYIENSIILLVDGVINAL